MPRSPSHLWCRFVLIALLAAPCASAQTVRVRALEDSTGAPVAGAMVRLLRGDSTLVQGLTSMVGRVTLLVPGPGRYRLQLSRIGYAAPAPIPIEIAAGETRGIDVALPAVRVSLPTVVVSGTKQCGGPPDERATAALLWEQIRQGLGRTQLSERSPRLFIRDTAVRELTRGGVIREEHRSPEVTRSGKPFVTRPPAELASEGFVRARDDSIWFYAPDADLLLSEQFVTSHCFTLAPPPDSLPGHIGLRFEPAARRRVTDIRGVLWVERKTVELRLLEFQYTSSPLRTAGATPGGRLAFGRLASGEFYVRDWVIRMPKIGRGRPDVLSLAGSGRDSLLGYVEVSGRATPSAEPRGSVTPALLTGLVYDSSAGRGLAGVVVTVAGAADRTVTDSLGTFALSLPVGGLRMVTLSHALLDPVPERANRSVELVPGATVHIVTATPAPVGLPLQEPAFPLPGLVVGSSRTAPAGERTLEPTRLRLNRAGAPPSALIARGDLEKAKSSRLMTVMMSHGIRTRVDPFGRTVLLCPRNAGRPAIYIDGQMVDRGESFTHEMAPSSVFVPPPTENMTTVFDLDSYPLERVEAIEIYASPSQQPTGFNQTGALCTVLVWSRQ